MRPTASMRPWTRSSPPSAAQWSCSASAPSRKGAPRPQAAREQTYRRWTEPLIGADADWENPAALRAPSQAIGLSPAATALRIATEDLATELRIRRPELVAKSGPDRQ